MCINFDVKIHLPLFKHQNFRHMNAEKEVNLGGII